MGGVDEAMDIMAEECQTVLSLLERHLPGTAAWVYGSRAKRTSRPQSDLDLVVFATPEQRPQIGDLREAFEESNLPFRVDLFVWDEVPDSFREQIHGNHVALGEATSATLPSRKRPDAYAEDSYLIRSHNFSVRSVDSDSKPFIFSNLQ